MSDYERYGDYNDIEDEAPKKSPILITMRILTGLVCILVVGVLFIRLALFSNYPKEVKNIYYNDSLTEYYNASAGQIDAKTQPLQYAYSDSKNGYFFCKHLVVVEGIQQIQITVRYNTSNIKYINEDFGVSLDPKAENLFNYRLCTNKDFAEDAFDENGVLKADAEPQNFYLANAGIKAKQAQYRYEKLVFDGVDFSTANGDDVKWMRLDIMFPDGKRCASVVIYENNENYSQFDNYEITPPGEEESVAPAVIISSVITAVAALAILGFVICKRRTRTESYEVSEDDTSEDIIDDFEKIPEENISIEESSGVFKETSEEEFKDE